MKHARYCLRLFGIVLPVISMGCSQAQPVRFAAPTIPSGSWQGRGTYAAYEAVGVGKDDPSPEQRFQDGVYDTSLDITKRTLFGRQAIVIEIRSKRSKIFDSHGTETHFRALLLRLKSMTNGSTLYALGRLEFDPKEPPDYQKHEAEIRRRSNLPSASCVTIGQQTCLQIHYFMPEGNTRLTFKDTLVFSGSSVLKTGSVAGTAEEANTGGKPKHKVSQIYWVERLGKMK